MANLKNKANERKVVAPSTTELNKAVDNCIKKYLKKGATNHNSLGPSSTGKRKHMDSKSKSADSSDRKQQIIQGLHQGVPHKGDQVKGLRADHWQYEKVPEDWEVEGQREIEERVNHSSWRYDDPDSYTNEILSLTTDVAILVLIRRSAVQIVGQSHLKELFVLEGIELKSDFQDYLLHGV